jgi:hypothetical protein
VEIAEWTRQSRCVRVWHQLAPETSVLKVVNCCACGAVHGHPAALSRSLRFRVPASAAVHCPARHPLHLPCCACFLCGSECWQPMFLTSPSQVRGIAADELFEHDAPVLTAPPVLNLEYGNHRAGEESGDEEAEEGRPCAGAGAGAGAGGADGDDLDITLDSLLTTTTVETAEITPIVNNRRMVDAGVSRSIRELHTVWHDPLTYGLVSLC